MTSRSTRAPATGMPGRADPPVRFSRRRLLAGAAALGAAGLGLAGCSGTGSSEPLQFWNAHAPQPSGDPEVVAQSEWYLAAIDHWNAHHPEQVVPMFVPDYVNPMNPRIATAFAAENGPDIFMISPGEFLRYYNGGVLLDLKPYLTPEALDDFYPEALGTRIVGDGIYGIPIEIDPVSLYYDVQAFEESGLSEGDLPTTWDQLLDVAERLTTPRRSGLVLETKPGYYQNFMFYPWLWQCGGEVVDPATQLPGLDSDAAVAALEFFGEGIARGVAPRTLPAGGEIVPAFTQGLAAMWQTGPWTVAEFELQAPGHRYGVLPLPLPPDGRRITSAGGWAWAVNNRGRNPDAAARFVVESIGSMSAESIARGADWNYRAKSNLPPRKSVAAASEQLPTYDQPARAAVRELLSSTRGEPRYPPVLYKALSNAIQSVQLAGGDARTQARLAQDAIESFLQTYEGGALV
ncbi:ABC transporter substrate-binding protein [Pseudonocardia kunmingensis]|uniref:Carbohydrate ABC transporter substrate-binding protein (CUT1 family) n=1 Tax=Pseudonocardia kunmingensis TaxID=630975 RepID=A0A543D9D1_9PSEU|nr:sugar ABC transporter substrate-binding protein [Pseudonocardia kunmingensis]TQM05932.1 carbohydrate ABC transporter substrate-binding protein (CUT1 family) [Pseudonocardia kunmingensis]